MEVLNREHEDHRVRNDLIVVAVILALALMSFLAFHVRGYLIGRVSADKTGPYAVVESTEGEYDILPLSQDTSLTVVSDLGTNTIVVEDGHVSIVDSDCKNQVCVETGEVGQVGDTIVCLPHHLVIQIVDDPQDAYSVG